MSTSLTEQFTAQGTCGDLWFTPRNGVCHCGDSIHDVFFFVMNRLEAKLRNCFFCMTNDSVTNHTVVGAYFFNCVDSTQIAP